MRFLPIRMSLFFQFACMVIFLNVCLVFVCKVSRSSSVCVSCLPLFQKAHFLPTTPAFFYCSSASLQSFPFLLISMMFPFISSTFSFTPHITHVWLFSLSLHHSTNVRGWGKEALVFFYLFSSSFTYIGKGTNIEVWLTFDYCSLDRSHHATQFLG